MLDDGDRDADGDMLELIDEDGLVEADGLMLELIDEEGEVEADESYFGGRRKGKQKAILKRMAKEMRIY